MRRTEILETRFFQKMKAMRRGSKELQAKYNTTDMIDILYAEATK